MNPTTTAVPASLTHTPLANIPMAPARTTVRRSRLAVMTTPTSVGVTRAASGLIQACMAFTVGAAWVLTILDYMDAVTSVAAIMAGLMGMCGLLALVSDNNPYLTVAHKAAVSVFLSATGATLLTGAMVALMAGTWANLAILAVAAVAAITTSAYTQATN